MIKFTRLATENPIYFLCYLLNHMSMRKLSIIGIYLCADITKRKLNDLQAAGSVCFSEFRATEPTDHHCGLQVLRAVL